MWMLNFIYDSLDTVKNLKFPGVKVYVTLTIAIFAIVIVSGLYFVLADYVFGEGYKIYYEAMGGTIETVVDNGEIMIDPILTGSEE